MSLLTVSGVSVRRGHNTVVRDVDLRVEPGETLALLGPNGAGKSTLLEAIGGVLAIASGTVEVQGRVASVLQSPGLARRSVRANVEIALAWWGVPRSRRRARAMSALEQMRATHLAGRPAAQLSGGERRRVHVARGLALRPDLLLLDEPFAGLDSETRAALCEDTSCALKDVAGAVVVVLHDRGDAWALADRLAVLMAGRLVAHGRPFEVLERPPSVEVARFLGYDGQLRRDDEVVLTRAAQVRVRHADDPGGGLLAVVTRVVAQQDGARLELEVPGGVLRAWHTGPRVEVGDRVLVTMSRTVTFPAAVSGVLR